MRLDVETLQQQILEPSGGGGGGGGGELYFERPQGPQDRARQSSLDRIEDRPSEGSGRGSGEGKNFGLLEVPNTVVILIDCAVVNTRVIAACLSV